MRNLLALLVIVLCWPVAASTSTFKFSHFTPDSHNVPASISDMVQDKNGYLYLSSIHGLVRFNGSESYYFRSSPSDKSTLNSNAIYDLELGQEGELWVATALGLNRLDLTSDKVKRYEFDPGDPQSLPSGRVNSVLYSNNYIWVGTEKGLARMAAGQDRFEHIALPTRSSGSNSEAITQLVETAGSIAFIRDRAEILLIDKQSEHISLLAPEASSSKSIPVELRKGVGDKLLISYLYDHLDIYDIQKQSFESIDLSSGQEGNKYELASIYQQRDGSIWVGTQSQGLFKIDKGKVEAIPPNNVNPDGLPPGRILKIIQDKDGHIWLSTVGKGLSLLARDYNNVGWLHRYSQDWHKLSDNVVWGMAEDKQQRLWLGTDGEGVHVLNWQNKTNQRFVHNNQDQHSLSNNRVFDIFESKRGEIWLSTANGLNLYQDTDNSFKHYFTGKNATTNGKLFSAIFEDSAENLWVATLGGGLIKFDPQRQYQHISAGEKSIASDFVTAFTEDGQKRIWIGTRKGVSIFDPGTGHYQHLFSNSEVWSLYFDRALNKVLVGTANGLAIYATDTQETTWLEAISQLGGYRAYCILASDEHYLVATDIGLSKISKTGEINNFHWYHGLQDGYNLNGCAQGPSGRNYFSGGKGVSYFEIDKLRKDLSSPVSNITAMNIYDENQGGFTEKVTFNNGQATLPHFSNNLRIYFDGIYYPYSKGLSVKYRLLGLNQNWTTDKQSASSQQSLDSRSATFTNLSPGQYTFEVQFQVTDQPDSNIARVSFEILPPWWLTLWAKVLYLILFALSIYLLISMRTRTLQKEKHKLAIQVKERTRSLEQMAQKATELASQKNQLFANISHELKNPLTMMLNPINSILEQSHDQDTENRLSMLKRNTMRMANMVDQMLELSMLDSKPVFKTVCYVCDEVLEEVVISFKEIASEKDIDIVIDGKSDSSLQLVEDSLHKILLNLLSNAIKYSPSHTKIQLGCQKAKDSVDFWVIDEGDGFTKEEVDIVQQRFKRLSNAIDSNIPGSGLGLSIVKELIEANNGTLEIKANKQVGSSIHFSLRQVDTRKNEVGESTTEYDKLANKYLQELNFLAPTIEAPEPEDDQQLGNRTKVLIVEDNSEMQAFLLKTLSDTFNCILAANGLEGLQLAEQEQPDLIISDVVMPVVDGYEMVRKLRQSNTTSQIPIVLLTKRSDLSSRSKGLELVVDDYISKPFYAREVKQRVQNLLEIRKSLRETLASSLSSRKPSEVEAFKHISSKDQEFLQQFESAIEQSYQDPNLNRPQIASKLAMSERQLNRKLKALCDSNFTEYLRKYRLRKSLALANKGLLIAQISDMVGFANPTYFSSCFKNEFNKTYGQYQKTLGETIEE